MINRYDRGFDLKIPAKLFVAPVDILGKVLEIKQKEYDKNEAALEEIPLIADKIKALGSHKQIVNGIVNDYYGELLDAAEKHGGDFSELTPKILSVKRRISRDVAPTGRLGKIHSFAESYGEWFKTYKNDKDIDLDLLNGFAGHIIKSTNKDLDKYAKGEQFEPSVELLQEAVPRSQAYILDNLMKAGDQVEEQTTDRVYQTINKETGVIEVHNRKVKSRDPNILRNVIVNSAINNADLKQAARLNKLLGRDYNANGVVNSAYQAKMMTQEDESLSLHALSKDAAKRLGISTAEEDGTQPVELDRRNIKPSLDLDKFNLFSMWNHGKEAWNKKYDSQTGAYKGIDDSWDNIKFNKVNSVIDDLKRTNNPNVNPAYESEAMQNLRKRLSVAQDDTQLEFLVKQEVPQFAARNFNPTIEGVPIVDPTYRKQAVAHIVNGLSKGEALDKDGNLIGRAYTTKEINEMLKNGNPLFKINSAGHAGFGLQFDNKLIVIPSADPDAINQANRQKAVFDNGGRNVEKFNYNGTEYTSDTDVEEFTGKVRENVWKSNQ